MTSLSQTQVAGFITQGFVRLNQAFSCERAAIASSIIFESAGIDPSESATWSPPVMRLDGSTDAAVVSTINTPRLTGAINQLVGAGRWLPRTGGFGTFPVRFPSQADPRDVGWHVDGSFGGPPFYKVNAASRGRALLLLMLYTDVTMNDAPTRIRVGSHLEVARALERLGKDITFVPERHAPRTLDLTIEHAIGPAGTVYLCHPFLVHAASWPHTGTGPRLIAQPCIHHPEGEWRGAFDYVSGGDAPVIQAVRNAYAGSAESGASASG